MVSESQYSCSTKEQSITKTTKILYLITDLSIGGAEMALFRLLKHMDRQRFQPVVLSLADQGCLRSRIEALGIQVLTLGINPGRPSPLGLLRLVRLINQLKPNLIVGWMYHSCLAAELSTWLSRKHIPTIWSLHFAFGRFPWYKRQTILVAKICRFLSKLPARIIVVSHETRRHLRLMRYETKNSCVIPNGVDVNGFVPSVDAQLELRRALGLPDNSLIVGIVGRYHPQKDYANFLRAANSLATSHSNVHFVLVGRGIDETNSELLELIDQLHLRKRVHLLGEHEDVQHLIAGFDIFALSSAEESCPNVIVEAMASGVPCVVTDVGDAALNIGVTGRVVPPRDSDALAAALRELLDLSDEDRRALGISARKRVIELFTIEAVVSQHESLYEAVINYELANESSTKRSKSWAIPPLQRRDNA